MAKALIGITCSRTQSEYGYPQFALPETYVRAVVKAGANPVVIPSDLPGDVLVDLVNQIDGLLLSGGGDIEPRHYQTEKHPSLSYVDPDRDRTEFYLLEHLLACEKPFLAICRGIQILNVALGGTLYVDIPSQLPGALKHDYNPGEIPLDFLAHGVQLEKSSRLAGIVRTTAMEVNSTHHQGIRELAVDLKAVAYAPDGLVEAVELNDYGFGIGVQWHPERLVVHAPMLALFQVFVKAAQDHRKT
jgi:putative glutamine amidotransferase